MTQSVNPEWFLTTLIIDLIHESLVGEKKKELLNMQKSIGLGNPITTAMVDNIFQFLDSDQLVQGITSDMYQNFCHVVNDMNEHPRKQHYKYETNFRSTQAHASSRHRGWQKEIAQKNGYETVGKLMQALQNGEAKLVRVHKGVLTGEDIKRGPMGEVIGTGKTLKLTKDDVIA